MAKKSISVEEYLEEIRKEPNIKVITLPLDTLLEEEKSVNIEVEIVALQILLAIKLGNKAVLEEDFALDASQLQLGRSITKAVLQSAIDAVEILEKEEHQEDYAGIFQILKEGLELAKSGNYKKGKEKKEVLANTAKKVSSYVNENFKDVLVQFESNQSVVYLLNLVNKAYADELYLTRVDKIIAALEILVSVRETGENNLIQFGKMKLEEFRQLIKGSVSFDIITICLNATYALIERLTEVDGMTLELKNKVMELKDRLERVSKTIKERK